MCIRVYWSFLIFVLIFVKYFFPSDGRNDQEIRLDSFNSEIYISVYFREFRGYSKYLPERIRDPTFVLIFVKYCLPSDGGYDQGYSS